MEGFIENKVFQKPIYQRSTVYKDGGDREGGEDIEEDDSDGYMLLKEFIPQATKKKREPEHFRVRLWRGEGA